jgi:hypothetical protein
MLRNICAPGNRCLAYCEIILPPETMLVAVRSERGFLNGPSRIGTHAKLWNMLPGFRWSGFSGLPEVVPTYDHQSRVVTPIHLHTHYNKE